MRKLIHSKFEIDLSNFKVSDTEENNWFSDSFFTKFTFPFEIDLTTDLDVALDFISYYTTNPQTYYEVMYQQYDRLEKATLEIESLQTRLSCTFSFGFEQLPNFDKKLSELPLAKFNLPSGTSIYDHANAVVSQTWPTVNYNFPMVHDKSLDVTDDKWAYFEKIINHRKEGVFLQNGIDPANNAAANRNIMQPMPYWLYVLQVGFADCNLTLTGDIVDDEYLKKATLPAFIDYNKIVTKQEYLIFVSSIQAISTEIIIGQKVGFYSHTTPLVGVGKFRIVGKIWLKPMFSRTSYAKIEFNNITVFYFERPQQSTISNPNGRPTNWTINIDIVVELDEDMANLLKVTSYCPFYNDDTSSGDVSTRFDLSVNPIADDEFIFVQKNRIDLKKCVPDVTFGDLIKIVKNWFNYDLTVVGNNAVMNLVESNIVPDNAVSLEQFEKQFPVRKFQQGKSFLLKFQDVDYPDFKYLPVFQNNLGVYTSGFKTNDKTATIEVQALPLPIATINGVTTAFSFENNDSKVYLVPYAGLTNGQNVSLPIDNYLMPAVHIKYWQKWFLFRIFSQGFSWGFRTWIENIFNLKVKDKIFAYNNYHIIKTITRTEVKPDLFDIEIETESLK